MEVDFHVANNGDFIAELQDGAAKVRTPFQAGKAGMKNANRLSLRRLELIAFEALVLPDSLQQFFGRRRILIVECINGTTTSAPDSVKIFGARIHAPIFFRERGRSQAALKNN
jgi:hypothetical protein